MSRSAERSRFDWRVLILLGWIMLVGARYSVMIVERKAPKRVKTSVESWLQFGHVLGDQAPVDGVDR